MMDLAATLASIEGCLEAGAFDEAEELAAGLASACAAAGDVRLDDETLAAARGALARCMERAASHRAVMAPALDDAARSRRAAATYARHG